MLQRLKRRRKTHLSNLIKSTKQLVQSLHQITGGQLFTQWSEIYNVRVQNGHVVVPLDVHFVKRLSFVFGTRIRHFKHYASFHLNG